MEVLAAYDPDERPRLKVVNSELDLKPGTKCPTCNQVIERRANLDDLRKVVMVYKLSQGYELTDKSWDKAFFRIYLPVAKKLMDFMGDYRLACDCIQETVERLKDWNPDATITLQKILMNHAARWKKDWQEKNQNI